MSKKSLKSNRNGKDSGSDEEDEEGLQEALKELVKIPDIETIEDKDKNKDEREVKKQRKSSLKVPKNQVEQGSQTVDNREKANPLKPYLSKIDSDDSWTTIFIRRFSWNKNPKSESTPPEVKPNIDKEKQNAVEIISKQVKENIKDIKGDGLHKIKSSPESSSERLIRTEHYGYSIPRTWETKNNTHDLSDEESEEDTPEFIEKLRKIEEASKPKTWKRPQPTIIKNKLYSSSHKSRENQLEVKSNKDNEEQHRYINILNAPFQRNLKYPAVDETNNPLTLNKVSEDKDTQSIDPEKETPEGVPIESAAPQNVAQKSHKLQGKKSKEKFKEKKADTTDSQRTLTITGHSHITTKWDNHCHFRENQHGVDKKARRILIIACVLCFVFLIVEVVGGVVSNSLAIATDAAHLLTDLASFLISLFALYLAGRPSSERLSFGWYRAEVIGAMISVFFIWVITGILVYLAIMRWVNQEFDLEAKIMLITSALAILFNIVMAVQLNHGHSHFTPGKVKPTKVLGSQQGSKIGLESQKPSLIGRSISTQFAVKGEHQNINVRAAFIHVIGDLLQSVGVFIAALIIFFKPEWAFMDSICTFLFSVLVLAVTFKILKDVLMVLMEATPDFMDYEEVKQTFLSIPGVEHVHNLRIWALSINKIALSAHLAISKEADPQLILEEATILIHKRYRFFETTIQIEEYSPEMENCEQCAWPTEKKDARRTLDLEEVVANGHRKNEEMEPTNKEN